MAKYIKKTDDYLTWGKHDIKLFIYDENFYSFFSIQHVGKRIPSGVFSLLFKF